MTSSWPGMVIGPKSASSPPPERTRRPLDQLAEELVVDRRRPTYTRSMPTQVWPALAIPPQTAASAAASRSASASTIIASLPPHSISTGVSVSAQAAMTFLAGRGRAGERDLVHAGPAQRARRSSPAPVTTCSTGCSGTTSAKASTSHRADRRGVLARLEHHRVAGRQRVRDRAHRGEDRVVPRPDHADHAERLVLQRAPRGWRPAGRAATPARPEHPRARCGPPSRGARWR